MTEAQLQKAVLSLAKLLGWHPAAVRPARTLRGWRTPWAGDGKGFPDLILCRPEGTGADGHWRRGRLLFRELKAGRGGLRPEQVFWLAWLRGCGPEVDAGTWTEKEWLDGTIEKELRT